MKTIKMLYLLVFVAMSITFIAVNTHAQGAVSSGGEAISSTSVPIPVTTPPVVTSPPTSVPPNMQFLSSRAALRTYAAELSRSAEMNVESKGFANGSIGFGSGWSESQTLQQIQDHFNNWNYEIEMVNVNDYITMRGTILSSEWEKLFVSYDSTVLAQQGKGGQYYIPQPYLSFRLADEIPIRVGRSIVRANISFIGDDGRTVIDQELRVDNGKVYFKPEFAGKGLLTLTDNNNNRFVYDLRNRGIQVKTMYAQFSGAMISVEGFFTFKDPNLIDLNIWSYRGLGENPTLEITMNVIGRYVNVALKTTEDAVPKGYWVRRQGTTDWQYYPASKTSKYTSIFFYVGMTTYVVADWNSEEFKEPDPVQQEKSWGGEKG